MTKRVITFSSASCTGWCYAYEADDHQQRAVSKLAQEYNSSEQWKERNCDGSVLAWPSVEAAIAHHNKDRDECDDPAGRVTDLAGLFAFYAADGDGTERSLAFVLVALASDPTAETWPLSV